jgi:hypothetical protein
LDITVRKVVYQNRNSAGVQFLDEILRVDYPTTGHVPFFLKVRHNSIALFFDDKLKGTITFSGWVAGIKDEHGRLPWGSVLGSDGSAVVWRRRIVPNGPVVTAHVVTKLGWGLGLW